jgi:DNA-binding beta-propeller fold protein YncE
MAPPPSPSDPARTRRDFLLRGAAGLAAAWAGTRPGAAPAAPAPVKPGGFIVLDNCDPTYQGKDAYEDNLSFFDASGKLAARVSGLNNCEEIGSPHKIAVDLARGRVWVTENVGHRILRYDLTGRQLGAFRDIKASALAHDPATGHLWVLRSTGAIGGGSTEVLDQAGRSAGSYNCHGWDIAYDGRGKAFWLADRQLTKISTAGKVLLQKPITDWCASSLAVDQRTGAVWVATREHSARLGKNELLGFDNDGRLLHRIALGARTPFRIAVDSRDGSVWVTILRGAVCKYTAAGKPDGEHKLQALAADVDPQTGDVWAVTADEVVKLDKAGKVLATAKHKAHTSQVWVASY